MPRTGVNKGFIVLGLILPLLLGGCAATDSVKQAQDTANAAKTEADNASAVARQALQAAQAANAKADKAEADVQALTEKTDRVFQKSLRK